MINSNFGFTPLKEIWLGDCYPASFYDHLPSAVRDAFYTVTEWTKEDTKRLQDFLESKGIIVRRPVFKDIDNYLDSTDNLIKPPITPRDNYLVLGKTLYSLLRLGKYDPWQHWIDHYQSQGFDVQQPKDKPINCVQPPSLVRVGKDLVIDTESHKHIWGFVCQWMVETAQNYRINISNTKGHTDSVFCPVAKNVIVTSHWKTDYSESFPGWEVFHVPAEFANHYINTNNNNNTWKLNNPILDNNKEFNQHVMYNAPDWVGDFRETVFEVNMLVIDEHNVVAMKEYPPLFEWLEKRGITVHLFDFRARTFWDGGWHCLTLDIHRDDSKLDLFPDRGSNGVYWRLQ